MYFFVFLTPLPITPQRHDARIVFLVILGQTFCTQQWNWIQLGSHTIRLLRHSTIPTRPTTKDSRATKINGKQFCFCRPILVSVNRGGCYFAFFWLFLIFHSSKYGGYNTNKGPERIFWIRPPEPPCTCPLKVATSHFRHKTWILSSNFDRLPKDVFWS